MTDKTLFKDTDSEEFKAGVQEGIRRVHNMIQYTIANSDNAPLNDLRDDIAEDILEYAPEFHGRWKEMGVLRNEYLAATALAVKRARVELLKELNETTILNDLILSIAQNECGLKQVHSCCNVSMKTCGNDVWQGDIAGFVRHLFKRALPKE